MTVVGHQTQRERLCDLIERDRLPSALLFSGASGIGKFRVALEVAGHLLCSSSTAGSCGECEDCRLIKANTHPDLHVVECHEHGKVADGRQLISNLGLAPFRGGSRVAILRDAEDLTVQTCNALLKSLEEPRANVYFILVTCAPRSLPSTVLSRCQIWHFERLSEEDLRQAGNQAGLQLPNHVVQAAEGSIGRAQELLGTSEFPVEFESTLIEIATGGPIDQCVELSRILGQHKQRTSETLSRLATFARSRMRASIQDVPLCEQWARFLSATLSAEHLLLDRNFTPQATYFALLRTLMPLPMPRFTGEVGSDTYFARLL